MGHLTKGYSNIYSVPNSKEWCEYASDFPTYEELDAFWIKTLYKFNFFLKINFPQKYSLIVLTFALFTRCRLFFLSPRPKNILAACLHPRLGTRKWEAVLKEDFDRRRVSSDGPLAREGGLSSGLSLGLPSQSWQRQCKSALSATTRCLTPLPHFFL